MTPQPTIFVVNTLHSGGAEKQLLWIAKTLVERGPVTIVELNVTRGSSRVDHLIEEVRAAGVRFSRATGSSYVRALWRLGREMRAAPGAVVWSWGMRADLCVFIWKLFRLCEVRWVCSLRNAHQRGVDSSKWLYRWFVSHVSLFVANTHANCEMLATVCPAARPKCRVLPNVVRELQTTPPVSLPAALPRILRVAMLGNIDIDRKGYDTAVEVARSILAERLPVELHIAGRPDDLDWLQAEVVRHRLDRVVHYHGEVRVPLEYLRRHDAFLLLSRFEGMPNAFLEALCIGLPTIVTAVGDLARIVPEPQPYEVIPHSDPQRAVAALKALLADWPAAISRGARGRAWCEEHFSEAGCRKQLLAIHAELVSPAGSSR